MSIPAVAEEIFGSAELTRKVILEKVPPKLAACRLSPATNSERHGQGLHHPRTPEITRPQGP